MRVIELSGTPRAMGEAFGETCRKEIQTFYETRLQIAIEQAKLHGGRTFDEGGVRRVAKGCLAMSEGWHPDGYAELVGIARAANLAPEDVWAMNGLTDLRDILAWSDDIVYGGGCSSFIVQGDRTTDGRVLCGQTWDLATNNMPFVLGVHRRPHDGPQTWSLTTTGCLSLIGMNEEGISVGTTNLRTTDARVGVCYLSMVHAALSERTFEPAVARITDAPRAGGHYFSICDGEGNAAAVECTATLFRRLDITSGHHVQCNHVLAPEHVPLEAKLSRPSSHCRRDRMDALLTAAPEGSLDTAAMRGLLSNHEDGDISICRHGADGISSNGAVVMAPQAPALLACHGPPCESEWTDLLAGPA